MQMWPGFRSAYFWDVMRRHFRLRHITPPVPFLDLSKHQLGIHLPHAVFPMANMLNPPLFGLPGTGERLCNWYLTHSPLPSKPAA